MHRAGRRRELRSRPTRRQQRERGVRTGQARKVSNLCGGHAGDGVEVEVVWHDSRGYCDIVDVHVSAERELEQLCALQTFVTVRAFPQLYTTEEMNEWSANGLFSNTPIDSNDEPPMNNQQYCTLMASLHNPPKRCLRG